jgi:hypothetical protein
MPVSPGEAGVGSAFAELAETLASDVGIDTYLAAVCRNCVTLIGAVSAAIVFPAGSAWQSFDVVTSRGASAPTAPPQAAPSQAEALWHDHAVSGFTTGPLAECLTTGRPIVAADLRAERIRWPWFAETALQAGLVTLTVLPVSARSSVVGAMAILGRTAPDAAGIDLARSLAEAAGTGIFLNGELRRQENAVTQLQSALTSRVLIEQAKGILAERWKVAPDTAFHALRQFARNRQRRLPEVARGIIDGSIGVPAPDTKLPPDTVPPRHPVPSRNAGPPP